MTRPGNYPFVESLSARELEIVRLLAKGYSNREIAEKLILSLETIKWYNKRFYGKLGVGGRAQAVARAIQYGLLDEQPEGPTAPSIPTRTNLPAELTSFVGRERQIAKLRQLLREARLVTLTGPGGVGKTRLALQVAAATAGHYADGVIFVSLAATREPGLVTHTIAQALGVLERADWVLARSLKRYVANKQLLLLLDNFEHLLEAAPLVAELLAAAPGLAVLTTSRERLRLSGEHEFLVPPLALPEPSHPGSAAELSAANLSGIESVTLFVQRARAASHDFRLTDENAPVVAAICRRLDGLPLAIELAAARVKLFTPSQILERLEKRLSLLASGPRDLPDRQRTLRDAIDWSYELLNEDERQLFARLGVFSGGSSLRAAEAICGPGLHIDTVDGLASLLDKSLLYQTEGPGGEPRLMMLETIHEYARERLAQGGEEHEVRKRHLEYFLALAEEMEPGYRRHGQLLLMERTKVEMANLRAAFEWAMTCGNFEAAARLVSAIDYYLEYTDRLAEGYHWSAQILDRLDQLPGRYQARLLLAASRLARVYTDLGQGKELCQAGLALAREFGDRANEAWLLTQLAVCASNNPEEHENGVRLCGQGLQMFREMGDKPGMAYALNVQGELARVAGEYEQAREAYEASLALCRETGEAFRQVLMLTNLAFLAYRAKEYRQAKELAESHLRGMVDIAMTPCIIMGLALLAGPLGELGEPGKGARLLAAGAALMAEIGAEYQFADALELAEFESGVRAQLDEAEFDNAWAEGSAMTLDQAVAYALGE